MSIHAKFHACITKCTILLKKMDLSAWLNSVVHGQISPNFEIIQALMYIIFTCKYEMNPIKNFRKKVMTPFFQQ